MKIRLTKQAKLLLVTCAIVCVVGFVKMASINYVRYTPQEPSFSLNEHDALLDILKTSNSSREVLRRNQYVSYIGR